MNKEELIADFTRTLDEKRPLGLYCVFYDGETRPVAGFVLEQDAERYAKQHAGGATWEVRHAHVCEELPPKAKAALEAAHHELTTLHNLTVTDRPDEKGLTWVTDTSEAVRLIDEALEPRTSEGVERL